MKIFEFKVLFSQLDALYKQGPGIIPVLTEVLLTAQEEQVRETLASIENIKFHVSTQIRQLAAIELRKVNSDYSSLLF
jgi:hypothetical protein